MSAGPAQPPCWREQAAIVAALAGLSALAHFNRTSMSVAGNLLIEAETLSQQQMGLVYSTLLLVYTLCMTPGGWLTDLIGGRRTIALVGLGSAVLCVATGGAGWWSRSAAVLFASLLVVRAVFGAFNAPFYPAAGKVVSQWVPLEHRALANALITAAFPVGVALAYPLFGGLCGLFGWQAAFLVAGVATAAAAAAWLRVGQDEPPAVRPTSPLVRAALHQVASEAEKRQVHWRGLVRNRSLWLLAVSYSTVGYVEYLLIYWLERYLKQVMHYSTTQSRLASMIPMLCMAACMPLGGWMSDRLMPALGYRRARAAVALLGMCGCAGCLFASTFALSAGYSVAAFAAALAAIGVAEAPAWATAVDLGGKDGATSAAVVNTGGNGGGVISPSLSPWLVGVLQPLVGEAGGWAWALRLGSLVCLLGGLLWLWIDASERAPASG